MLFLWEDITKYKVSPSCILHVGAHEAEEKEIYKQMGCDKVLWIESMYSKYEVIRNAIKNEPNMSAITATVWSKDNQVMTFYETNNGQSSSVFELEKHREKYPGIVITKQYQTVTSKIDTIIYVTMKGKYIPDMICIDIQGAELEAFKGATNTLKNVKWIYTEVSYEALYKGAALEPELTEFLNKKGFVKLEENDTGMGWGDALYAKN
jgi:FkbM family methyltransferase